MLPIDHELGRPTELGSSTGLKYGKPQAELVNKQRKAFLKEIGAMMRLRSPHTVNLFGAITSRKNRLVLVMELLSGGDLRAFLKSSDKRLPVEHARRIICDVCAGTAFCHSKDVVHGDLKSANVLLDGAGRAKVGHMFVVAGSNDVHVLCQEPKFAHGLPPDCWYYILLYTRGSSRDFKARQPLSITSPFKPFDPSSRLRVCSLFRLGTSGPPNGSNTTRRVWSRTTPQRARIPK